MMGPSTTPDLDTLADVLRDRGHVRVPGAFSRAEAAAMVDVVWDELAAVHGVLRDDPATWMLDRATKLQGIKTHPVSGPIGGPRTVAAVDAVLGAGCWERPRQWGGLHIGFPDRRRPYDVSAGPWHADFHYTHAPEPLPGLTLFAFLADVEPRAGGTAVIERSPTLVARLVQRSDDAERRSFRGMGRAFAASHPWLADLVAGRGDDRVRRFMKEGATIDGVEVRVTELCGEAGDVIVMHPWCWHAVSPNVGTQPRIVRAKILYRHGALAREPAPR